MNFVNALTLFFAVLELVRPTGLKFTHRNSPTDQKYLIETMGGGVALLDYNNDGRLDIFLVNSGKLPEPFGRQDPAYWNRLYRQNQDGSFTDVTVASGLSKAANSYGMGVATGDYDDDGYTDLYVTGFGANQLYHNNGNGTFSDTTPEAAVAGGGWSVSAGFFDYDKDGRLDLFVTRYLDYELSRNLRCGTPFRAYCRPDKYEGVSNLLFHNEGNGRFRDASAASHIASFKGKGMGVAFNDYDDDGYPDIFVSNDLTTQSLFHNQGDGTFEERALDAGAAFSDDGKAYSGMGAAFADYDNDGRPDILVTNLAMEKWALYRNEGEGNFYYATLSSGLSALVASHSGWGVGLYDFDNDGWKDIVASQSHVLDNVEMIQSSLRYAEPPGLYRNRGGRFERGDLGAVPEVAGRGIAFGDLNNDGMMDAVVAVLGGQPLVLKGRPNGNHWLTLKLAGTRSNRDGQGAKVRIGNRHEYASTAGSYLSASDSRVHFGLGTEMRAEIDITWPSGKLQRLEVAKVDRVLTVTESE